MEKANANERLIDQAASVLNRHESGDRVFGTVGATIVTKNGNTYNGVCIDTGSGTGFCAEAAAIGAMVTAGEYEIDKIVAVWRGEQDGKLYVLPPCGRCREFIRQIDERNLDTEIVLGMDKFRKLRDLLPNNEWPDPIDSARTGSEEGVET